MSFFLSWLHVVLSASKLCQQHVETGAENTKLAKIFLQKVVTLLRRHKKARASRSSNNLMMFQSILRPKVEMLNSH